MKTVLLKGLLVVGALLVSASAGVVVYVARTWDRVYDAPLPEITHSTDPDVLGRGEYLVYGPSHCVQCHGASVDALDLLQQGTQVALSGGLALPLGPLGVVYASNLTPDAETGIGRYTDPQLARMMRWAVRPDGRGTVEPLMPFGNLSDEDLVAIISYLRAQPPVRNAVPANEWTTMGKVIRSFSGVFKPRASIDPPPTAPAQAGTKARGEYLARYAANCVGCHTPRDPNTFEATGPDFAGGMQMEPMPLPDVDPAVWFLTPNVTPGPGSSLLKFPDRETFVTRFQKGGRPYRGSPMPWEAYARMASADLEALYEFLTSRPAEDGPTGEPTFTRTN